MSEAGNYLFSLEQQENYAFLVLGTLRLAA